ncbi:uncharacterized protein LOC9629860 [Selaginella moellendorffii]|uniref:uncharacterized protein LOC9629860 n=1 Tax=Selaginella moellendorffii TaxID=88036 RepID=UPI000D1C23EA|nr:uncharacterized protein LOC9629860 [Selaginella moellendorffii]|eukprot:XP_024519504.1 uncharacterized protein LOC9629860 [Selaginella moellendorffii]
MHILSLLPVEDIVWSHLVCKQWDSLLNDPHFKALWARNSRYRTPTFVLLQEGTNTELLKQRTRYYKYPSGPYRLQDLPRGWDSWLTPEGSELFLSAGGLVVCIIEENYETRFFVGNPLTQQWVTVPALKTSAQCRRSFMLIPYMSEGLMFFRMAIDPYLFDSKVGIWTFPPYQTMWTLSSNTLHIQGVQYGLGICQQHSAVVLLEIDDLGALSESKWLWAWDVGTIPSLSYSYMLEIGGEIGILVATMDWEVVVLVLDRKSGKEWSWRKVSALPKHFYRHLHDWVPLFDSRTCCTHGNLTFLCVGMQVLVFDSQRMTWELVGKRLLRTMELLVWVPDFTAVPNVNTPSEKLKQSCASKYPGGSFHITPGTFSEVEALSKRGMPWQQIGEVALDRNKENRAEIFSRAGGSFNGNRLERSRLIGTKITSRLGTRPKVAQLLMDAFYLHGKKLHASGAIKIVVSHCR